MIQDSDLEYDPNDYAHSAEAPARGQSRRGLRSRFLVAGERRVLLYWHSLGNQILTWLSNILADLNLTDMETCYKAVRARRASSRNCGSPASGSGSSRSSQPRLAQSGARIYEVPISYHGRTYAEGKNIGWRDGIQAMWLLFKFRFLDTRFTEDHSRASLESLGTTSHISRWMVDQFDGAIGDRVLEAGSGIGQSHSAVVG